MPHQPKPFWGNMCPVPQKHPNPPPTTTRTNFCLKVWGKGNRENIQGIFEAERPHLAIKTRSWGRKGDKIIRALAKKNPEGNPLWSRKGDRKECNFGKKKREKCTGGARKKWGFKANLFKDNSHRWPGCFGVFHNIKKKKRGGGQKKGGAPECRLH